MNNNDKNNKKLGLAFKVGDLLESKKQILVYSTTEPPAATLTRWRVIAAEKFFLCAWIKTVQVPPRLVKPGQQSSPVREIGLLLEDGNIYYVVASPSRARKLFKNKSLQLQE